MNVIFQKEALKYLKAKKLSSSLIQRLHSAKGVLNLGLAE